MRCFPIFLFLLNAVAAEKALFPFEAVEPHMGTLVRIKLYAEDERRAKLAFRAAFARIHRLDEALSDYKPDSELNRVCRTAVRQRVNVSADLFRVLDASQRLAEESGGAFDITLGPVIRLWRDARTRRDLPNAAELHEAGNRCGYRKLHLNAMSHSVMLDQAAMQLDVGGIAKGYAAGEALAVLNELGIRSALVALSGDLAFSDAPPGQRGWKIGIDSGSASGDHPESGFTRVLELKNAAVSTSGDAEQHLDHNGKRYSHIIDPKTMMGLTSHCAVTVIAARGIEADGVSTAVSVLGPDRGLQLVEKHAGAAALIVTHDGTGVRIIKSARFGEL